MRMNTKDAIRAVAVGLVVLVLFGIVGNFDYAQALLDEAAAKEARPALAARSPYCDHDGARVRCIYLAPR